jgi:prepilin-type N-terminal cleavage/methylation domain-containing protein
MYKRKAFTPLEIKISNRATTRFLTGFTLIELLVAISIIALLMAILVPSLRKARESAGRILCANRLRQWGMAITMHLEDKDGQLMAISMAWGNRAYPHYIYNRPRRNSHGATMWNIEDINPYIRAFSPNYENDGKATDMVTCPSCSGEFMQEWIRHINWPNHPFAEIAYSYFGRADLLDAAECGATAKKDLVGETLSATKLLMAEILNLDVSDSAYRYNHGITGWSWNEMGYINPSYTAYSPNPEATGRGQLFGDMHVEWKRISEERNLPIMSDRFVDGWDGHGSGWVGAGDVDYY